MRRRYEYYHFPSQFALYAVGVIGWCVRPPAWIPYGAYVSVCLLLVIQFWLRRKVKSPDTTPGGFPVAPPWGKSN